VLALRDKNVFITSGGYTLVAVAAGFIVAAAAFTTGAPGHRLLTNRLIVYVRKRSYAIYLWHYAIEYWLRDLQMGPQLVASFALSFVAAELSYRLVEGPALRLKGRIGEARKSRTDLEDLSGLEPGRVA
jgi:peptidoglycan/LPS O-acetylase OafA/YrhL